MEFRTISYEVALNGHGWRQGRYFDGMACGTRAAAAFVTSFRVYSPEVEYRAYLRGDGWSGWRTDGADSNDLSIATPIDAIQFRRVGGGLGLDLLYRAMFGTEFSTIGVASREDAVGAPGSGYPLQILQIFPVVPIYAQSPADLIPRGGAELDGPVFLDNPSLASAGRGSLEELHSPAIRLPLAVLQSRACLAGIGTIAPLCLETAAVRYDSGMIVANVRCARMVETGAPLVAGDLPDAPAGTLIADSELGTTLETPDRPGFDTQSLDIRPSAKQLLKAAGEGRARKGA
jgi:hypothetical protein